MPRQQGTPDISEAMCGGVLALHLFGKLKVPQISAIMKVNERTVRNICQKAKEYVAEKAEILSSDSSKLKTEMSAEDIKVYFDGVKINRIGKCRRKEKILKGSIIAEEPQDMPWWGVAEKMGLDNLVYRATIEKVVHKHLDIHRYIPCLKPPLTEENMRKRVEFARWALAKLNNGAIFIFTDETWIEIGGKRRQRKISQSKGANPYEYSCLKNRITLRVMFWGAIADGYKGPYHIWAKETAAEKEQNDKIIADMNFQQNAIVENHQARALIVGTEERRLMLEIHRKIVEGPLTASGRQPPRPPPQ